jgi:hypothetical protein
MTVSRTLLELFLVLLLAGATAHAQAPTGTIAGVIIDSKGAFVAAARVTITNRDNGLTRRLVSSEAGDFAAAALPAGTYIIAAEAEGFRRAEAVTTVQAGTTTTVNLTLETGDVSAQVMIHDVAPLINYESNQVGGVVSRKQIENLPLNGRNFLELAKLEPGVTAPTRGSNNRTFIPVLGAPGGQNGTRNRITVDGGSIMSIFNGASAMNFSQEVVQEFQLASVNLDLSTSGTASGAINIVTRFGGNEFHSDGFYFYRDHNLAAYPALNRDPTNPDPFFRRQQYGFRLGGPVRRDLLFFFVNWERNDQRGVVSVQPLTPEFAPLGQIAPSPFKGNFLSARVDYRATKDNYAYLRYSHDGSFSFASSSSTVGTGPPNMPSNWAELPVWADQSLLGVTTTLSPSLVNELRFSYFFISSGEKIGTPADCPAGCIGLGSPQIAVSDANFTIGRSVVEENMGRRFHFTDTATWQLHSHRLRFGMEFEYNRGGRNVLGSEPVQMSLFSPAQVRRQNALLPPNRPDLQIPLPASFTTVADILRLPLASFTIGIGNPLPAQPDFRRTRTGQVWHLFSQDTWHMHPRLTLNYGLGWFYDPFPNRDLAKPAYLTPIFGAKGLRAVAANRNNFSPSFGFAWSATRDGKTVIRGGGGVYYDTLSIVPFDPERTSLGPRGTGRTNFQNTRIINPLSNIPGVPEGMPLNFLTPSRFTGADLMSILAMVRTDLLRQRGDPNNRDFSVRNIEVDKLGQTSAPDLFTPYAIHLNLGLQREFTHNLVLTADFAYRHFMHIPGVGIDYNHFNSLRPVIPRCVGAQRDDPQALCSLGSINAIDSFDRAIYKGLLVRAEKRLSKHTQFLVAYAYSSEVGTNRVNNDNWLEGYGPLDRDITHILNASAIIELPFRFQLGFNSSYYSKPPFTAFVLNVDFNSDGTNSDVLPGTQVNRFNRGLGKADLERLVEQFNRNFAGRVTPRGQLIPTITLPTDFEFGDNYFTQDLRVSRVFRLSEKYRLTLIGEVFNLFNLANLSGNSGNLANTATFGQPTRRAEQVFGSGGPRAFQFGARLSF